MFYSKIYLLSLIFLILHTAGASCMVFSGPVVSSNESWVTGTGIICHLSLSELYNFDAWECQRWSLIWNKLMSSCWREGQSLHWNPAGVLLSASWLLSDIYLSSPFYWCFPDSKHNQKFYPHDSKILWVIVSLMPKFSVPHCFTALEVLYKLCGLWGT